MFQKITKIRLLLLFTVFMGFAVLPAQAKVSVDEANRLKKDLTPLGAQIEGNADGTIPAWDGGLTKIPPNVSYDPKGDNLHPDPFADDPILFTITAQNMDQYADKLTPGLIAMFKRFPDTFKMNVYQTRRTFAAPQWVYDNAYVNATEAVILGDDGTEGFTNSFGAIPFPIAKNGLEALYNYHGRYRGTEYIDYASNWLVHTSGSLTNSGTADYTFKHFYYTGKREDYNDKIPSSVTIFAYSEPPRRKGELVLIHNPFNYQAIPNTNVWAYMPGQRRVRRAPNSTYDVPNPTYGGLATWDESYLFVGRPDRYDWNLKGKKEMFIPYNCYQFETAPLEEVLTPNHINPKYVRWELHRVWVNEATLKEGCRHVYGKRVFYQDEDSWIMVLADIYDTRGALWRVRMQTSKSFYDQAAYFARSYFFYDLLADKYGAGLMFNDTPVTGYGQFSYDMFTPAHLRKLGKR